MSFLLKKSDTSCHSLGLYGPKLNKSILGNKLNHCQTVSSTVSAWDEHMMDNEMHKVDYT